MEEENRRIIIMFGGGIESLTLLLKAVEMKLEPIIFFVDYEQEAVEIERKLTEYWSEKLGVKYRLTKLKGYESLKEGRVYHFRNYIFTLLASALAKKLKINEVWLGGEYMTERDEFYDQYPEPYRYIEALTGIKVRLPLFDWKMNKKDCVKYLLEKNVDLNEEIVSCDYGRKLNENCNCKKHIRLCKILGELNG